MSATPRSWTLAVDFGTTATVAAIAEGLDRPLILEIGGERRMPSVVFIDEDGSIVVGQAAAGLAVSRPDRAIRAPKSRLDEQVPLVLGGQPYRATVLVTAVLRAVLAEAIQHQGSPPVRTRLTYPATWNRPRRAKLLEAATNAGMPDPVLIAEPVAAALTYAEGASIPAGSHVAVYDLGGGTFDTAVLQATSNGFRVVGRPLGDAQLGGELFDEMLMNLVGEKIDPDAWDELLVSDERPWRQAAARLRNESKRVKEALSIHGYGEVVVGLPGGTIEARVTQEELEELVGPYIDESIELLGRCIADAGITIDDVRSVYVTGGASRMPLVERRLREAYPAMAISRQGDPKAAVAFGALVATPESLDLAIAAGEHTTFELTGSREPTEGAAGYESSGPPSLPARPSSASPPRPQTPAMPPASMASQDSAFPAMPPASMASQDSALPNSSPTFADHGTVGSPAPPMPPPSDDPGLPGTPASPLNARPWYQSPAAIVGAAILGLILVGIIVVAATGGSEGGGADIETFASTPVETSQLDTSQSTTTLTTATTVAAQTATSPVEETASTVLVPGPGLADIESALLVASDVPSDWVPAEWVEDGTTLCDLPDSSEIWFSANIFDDNTTNQRILSQGFVYLDEAGALEAIAADRALAEVCPSDQVEIDGQDFIITVTDPTYEIPELGDETLGIELAYADVSGNVILTALSVESRWGRSFVLTTLSVPSSEVTLEDRQRLFDLHAIAVTRLVGIPR